MTFNDMVEDLIAKGLLTKDRGLTPKGHDYVEDIKKKYNSKIKPFVYGEGEEDDRTGEPKRVLEQGGWPD